MTAAPSPPWFAVMVHPGGFSPRQWLTSTGRRGNGYRFPLGIASGVGERPLVPRGDHATVPTVPPVPGTDPPVAAG
jgi:hypothetical protein